MDPADPSTWIITTAGIGPSLLGDLDDAAISASLAPAFVEAMRCEGLTSYDPTAAGSALSMYTAVSGYSSPEHPGFYRAVGITAWDAARLGEVDESPQTPEGIRLGSSLSELETAYPSLESWVDPRGTSPGVTEYVVADAAGTLLFKVGDDRVLGITATFDLPPVGYCS